MLPMLQPVGHRIGINGSRSRPWTNTQMQHYHSTGCHRSLYPSLADRKGLSVRKSSARLTCPDRAQHSLLRTYISDCSISVEGLQVQLGGAAAPRSILKGVNLNVKRGTLNMLLGPNGCGKSTLLKVLGGLIPASRGSVETDHPCAFVFQNPDHQVVMPTVAADVAFGLGRYDMSEDQVSELVRSALKLVNMEDYIYRATHTLSGGQKQRVAIAGALAENPRLLLLDELTTFLDRQDQLGVLEAVRKIMTERNDVTTIWVTHRFEELEYADSVTYMDDGKVVFTGTPATMRKFLSNLGAPIL